MQCVCVQCRGGECGVGQLVLAARLSGGINVGGLNGHGNGARLGGGLHVKAWHPACLPTMSCMHGVPTNCNVQPCGGTSCMSWEPAVEHGVPGVQETPGAGAHMHAGGG